MNTFFDKHEVLLLSLVALVSLVVIALDVVFWRG